MSVTSIFLEKIQFTVGLIFFKNTLQYFEADPQMGDIIELWMDERNSHGFEYQNETRVRTYHKLFLFNNLNL